MAKRHGVKEEFGIYPDQENSNKTSITRISDKDIDTHVKHDKKYALGVTAIIIKQLRADLAEAQASINKLTEAAKTPFENLTYDKIKQAFVDAGIPENHEFFDQNGRFDFAMKTLSILDLHIKELLDPGIKKTQISPAKLEQDSPKNLMGNQFADFISSRINTMSLYPPA